MRTILGTIGFVLALAGVVALFGGCGANNSLSPDGTASALLDTGTHHIPPNADLSTPGDLTPPGPARACLELAGGTARPGPKGYEIRAWLRRGQGWTQAGDFFGPAPLEIGLDAAGADAIYLEVGHVDVDGTIGIAMTACPP